MALFLIATLIVLWAFIGFVAWCLCRAGGKADEDMGLK